MDNKKKQQGADQFVARNLSSGTVQRAQQTSISGSLGRARKAGKIADAKSRNVAQLMSPGSGNSGGSKLEQFVSQRLGNRGEQLRVRQSTNADRFTRAYQAEQQRRAQAMAAAQAAPEGTFTAGSTDQVNQRVNDYQQQLKSYEDSLLLQDEKTRLEDENKWLSENDPLRQQNSDRIAEIDTLLENAPAEKPSRPFLDPKEYANESAAALSEDTGTVQLRTNAAQLQQQMEQEQRYWEDAQKRYQPDSRDYAEAKARWDRKYREIISQYQELGGQIPGGLPETGAQKQHDADMQTSLEDAIAQRDKAKEALDIAIGYGMDTDAAQEKYDAAAKLVDDMVAQWQSETPKKAEDEEAGDEEQEIEDAYLAFTQAQQQLENARSAMLDATGEDMARYRDAYNQAKENYEAAESAFYRLRDDANAAEYSARLDERADRVRQYETYRYREDFESVSQDAMENSLDAPSPMEPVGYYIANQEQLDLEADANRSGLDRLAFLSDDEIQMYYYQLGEYGLDDAKQYLDALKVTLDKRKTDYYNGNREILYGTSNALGKAAMNAASVLTNMVGGASSAVADVGSTIKGEFNPYAPGHEMADYANTVRGVTAQEIVDSIDDPFWGKVAANTYQALMSGADSALGATLFGNGYTAIMGASSASQRARELYEDGASDTQIALGAIASGAIEMATEKYSIESFTGKFLEGNITGFTDWVKKTLTQGATEASEEMVSELANLVADAVIRGANSDNSQEIQALIAQGMSEEDAKKQAFINRAVDTLWAGYGGFVSGGAMGGVGGVINATTSDARQNGKNIVDSGRANEVLDTALELRPDDKMTKYLLQLQEQGKLGHRGSDYAKLTDVQQQNTADLTGRDAENIRNAVQQRAETLGVTKNAGDVASAIVKQLTGDKLTMTERYALAMNKNTAAQILSEVNAEISSPGADSNVDSAWVRDVGTYNLAPGVFGRRQTQTEAAAQAQVQQQLTEAEQSVFGADAHAVGQLYQSGQSRAGYVQDMIRMYRAGQEGTPYESVAANSLLDAQKMWAYKAGQESVSGESYDFDNLAKGQSYTISDNSPVNIAGIESVSGGNLVLRTDDGGTVDAGNVKFGDYGTARLYKVIADMGVDADMGNRILDAAKNSRLSTSAYAIGVREAFDAGRNGVSLDSLSRDSHAMRMDEETRKAAWEAGRESRNARVQQKQEAVDSGKHGAKQGGLTVEDSAKNITELNEQQKSGMDAAKLLAEMGLDVTVYASTEADRKAGMENGNIRLSDGSIRVDLNAGADGQGVMAFALSHEFTHFVEEMSPKKFRIFTDILFEEMGKKGTDVSALIEAKAQALGKMEENKGLSENKLNDLAYSEVTAEMMETALTDTDVMERISARLHQTDKSLWGKIKDFLKGLVDWLKAAYKGLNPDSSIARLARETIRSSERALDAFADAASDAVVNYRLQDGQKNNAAEGVQYSLRGVNKDGIEVYETSDAVMSLSWKERKARYLDIMQNEYTGKTARFERNGHTYYAEFDRNSLRKPIYGDRRSDASGVKALIKAGADGEIFNLVESPEYVRSSANRKNHTNADYFDYFVKTVQIDGKVFDLIADVEKQYGKKDGYIYTLALRENTKIKASPAHGKAGKSAGNTFVDSSVSQPDAEVKEILKSSRDSEGNVLTEAQQRYFADSQVRDDDGNLKVVYHGSPAIFTEFSADFMGAHGSAEGQGFYFTDYKPMAEGYQRDGGQLLEGYLNIQKPLSDSDVTLKRAEVRKLLQAIDPTGDDLVLNYDSKGGMGYPSRTWYNRAVNDTLNAVMDNESDSEILGELANDMGDHGAVLEKARSVLGYDGYIVSGKYDNANVYVAFDSSQFKIADNQNPTGARDIRYSSRQRADGKAEQLATEVEYLKKLVQIQKKGNSDYTLDRTSLRQFASQLIRENGASGSSTELAALLEDTYNYISRSTDFLWEGIEERAGKAADWLEEHRKAQRDSYAQEVLDFMSKRHVKLSEAQLGEVQYQYGSLKEFRSAIRGSIVLDQNANTTLDQFWQEGAEQFGDKFSADITDTDMPGALAELVQSLKESRSTESMEADYYKDAARSDLIQRIYEGYWSAKPVESVSDKLKEEIGKLKTERNAALAELKRAKSDTKQAVKQALADYRHHRDVEFKAMKAVYDAQRAQIEQVYKQEMRGLKSSYEGDMATMSREFFRLLREYDRQGVSADKMQQKLDAAVKKLAESKGNEAIWQQEFKRLLREYDASGRNIDRLEKKVKAQQDAAKAKVENSRKTVQRGKLERTVAEINRRLLSPSKTLYVPDSLQPAVTMAMEAITAVRQQDTKAAGVLAALYRLQDGYRALTEANAGVFTQEYNEGILDYINAAKEAIGDTKYHEMNLEQLKAVTDAYTGILTAIRNANKMHAENLKQGYLATAQAAMEELRGKPSKVKTVGELKKTLEQASWNNEKPYYAFQRLDSDTMMRLYQNLRKGEDGWARDFSKARAYMMEAMSKYNYDKWKDALVEIEMADGQKVALDLEERLSLYAYSRRDQAINHLTGGGFMLTDSKRGGKSYNDYAAYKLSQEAVLEIRNGGLLELTAEQLAFATEMQQYLSTVCAEQNNEVSRALYSISKAKEEFYWPIKSSSIRSERIRNAQEFTGNKPKNAGHMKSTNKFANNTIELSGFMNTWADHVNATAMYHNFTLPMEDFYRVYNYTDGLDGLRQQMLDKFGDASVKYVDQLLKDLNGGLRADPRESTFNKLLSGFKKRAVVNSMSVAIQQPSAVGRAFAIIDPKYFFGLKVEKAGGVNATWAEMQQYAPVVTLKDIGRFDTDMGLSTRELLSGEKGSLLAKLDELGGKAPEFMDKITWVAMWEAAKRQVKARGTGLTGDALKTEAAKLFTQCITQTQVYDSVFSRSGNMRSKSGRMKMATAFMAEPTTTINMVESAIRDARSGRGKIAARKMASVTTAIVLNSILAAIVYAARDDDEEKTYLEKYMNSLTSEMIDGFNPLGYFPGIKDIWSIMQGYDVEQSDMNLFSTGWKAVGKMKKAWEDFANTDEDDEEGRKAALRNFGVKSLDAASILGDIGNIGLKNILREGKAVVNTVKTFTTPRYSDKRTMGYAIWQGWQENIPGIFRAKDSKAERLYDAVVSGSEAMLSRLEDTYSDDKKFQNAIITALQSEDGRITQAAKAHASGDSKTAQKLLQEIAAEGHFTLEQAQKAMEKQLNKTKGGTKTSIQEMFQNDELSKQEAISKLQTVTGASKSSAEETVQQWMAKKSTGIEYSDTKEAYLTGEITGSKAEDILVRYGGKKADDAKQTVKEWGCKKDLDIEYSQLKDAYFDGKITEQTMKNALVRYGGKTQEEAAEAMTVYTWQKQNPEYSDWSYSQALGYVKELDEIGTSAKALGIQPDTWQKYKEQIKSCTGVDANGDGRIDNGSVRGQVMKLIDGLPLSTAQKDALYYANGYSTRTLYKAPWH